MRKSIFAILLISLVVVPALFSALPLRHPSASSCSDTVYFYDNPSSGGSISVQGAGTFTNGQSASLTCGGQYQISPKASLGYGFTGWTTSGNTVSASSQGVDSVANTNFQINSVTSATVTLSTSNPDEVIMVYTMLYPGTVNNVSDSAGLTWHQRLQYSNLNEWYAVTPLALSSDQIKVSFSQTSTEYQIVAFGVYGVSGSVLFDPNSGLPDWTTSSSTSPSTSFSTTNGGDLVIAFMKDNHVAYGVTYPSGYNKITTATSNAWEYLAYQVFSAPQSATEVTWTLSLSDGWLAEADAISSTGYGAGIPPSIDASKNTGFKTIGVTSAALKLSTRYSNETLMVYAVVYPGYVSGVSDAAGLTWTIRSGNYGDSIYYAYAPNPLSNDTITVSFSQTSNEYQVIAFSVDGGFSSSYFDGTTVAASGSSSSPSVSFSTSDGYDMVVTQVQVNHPSADTVAAPSGYTSIQNQANSWIYLAYEVYASPQSSTHATWTINQADGWYATVDAISGTGLAEGVPSTLTPGYSGSTSLTANYILLPDIMHTLDCISNTTCTTTLPPGYQPTSSQTLSGSANEICGWDRSTAFSSPLPYCVWSYSTTIDNTNYVALEFTENVTNSGWGGAGGNVSISLTVAEGGSLSNVTAAGADFVFKNGTSLNLGDNFYLDKSGDSLWNSLLQVESNIGSEAIYYQNSGNSTLEGLGSVFTSIAAGTVSFSNYLRYNLPSVGDLTVNQYSYVALSWRGGTNCNAGTLLDTMDLTGMIISIAFGPATFGLSIVVGIILNTAAIGGTYGLLAASCIT